MLLTFTTFGLLIYMVSSAIAGAYAAHKVRAFFKRKFG